MAAAAEEPDIYLTLLRASKLVGIDQETLRVLAVRGRLRTVRRDGAHLTTRRWLYEYLAGRDAPGRHQPPHEGDRAPE